MSASEQGGKGLTFFVIVALSWPDTPKSASFTERNRKFCTRSAEN